MTSGWEGWEINQPSKWGPWKVQGNSRWEILLFWIGCHAAIVHWYSGSDEANFPFKCHVVNGFNSSSVLLTKNNKICIKNILKIYCWNVEIKSSAKSLTMKSSVSVHKADWAAVSSALWNLLKCEYLIMLGHGVNWVSFMHRILSSFRLHRPCPMHDRAEHFQSHRTGYLWGQLASSFSGIILQLFRSHLCSGLAYTRSPWFHISHVKLILFLKNLQSVTLIGYAKNKHEAVVDIWLRVESVVGRMNGIKL